MWSEGEPDTYGPANATSCVFENNIATDGGGIYSAAGYDIIRGCRFEANFAGTHQQFMVAADRLPKICRTLAVTYVPMSRSLSPPFSESGD